MKNATGGVKKPGIFGHIRGAIKYGAGAAVGAAAYLGQRSAQRGFKKYNNPTFKNNNTTQSNVNAARQHRESFGN